MAKKLQYFVHVEDADHGQQVFGPSDTVPAWAAKLITNPSAWADGEAADVAADGEDGDPADYSSWTKDALEAEVERRNDARGDDEDLVVVEGKGNKPDLVAALEADDARQG